VGEDRRGVPSEGVVREVKGEQGLAGGKRRKWGDGCPGQRGWCGGGTVLAVTVRRAADMEGSRLGRTGDISEGAVMFATRLGRPNILWSRGSFSHKYREGWGGGTELSDGTGCVRRGCRPAGVVEGGGGNAIRAGRDAKGAHICQKNLTEEDRTGRRKWQVCVRLEDD